MLFRCSDESHRTELYTFQSIWIDMCSDYIHIAEDDARERLQMVTRIF